MAKDLDISQVLSEAAARHISSARQIVPGFATIVLDEDVRYPYEKSHASAGLYFLRKDAQAEAASAIVYVLELDGENLEEELKEQRRREPLHTSANVAPLRDNSGREIALGEIMTWYAIADAQSKEEARAIFEAVYEDGTSSEDADTADEPKEEKRRYRRKSSGNTAPGAINFAMDSLTNALMGRDSGHIDPVAYFMEEPATINTGAGGYVLLDVRAREDIDINAIESAYQLNDRDRFWLDALYTIAMEDGKTSIEGSEILKLRGYANPYAENSETTMKDAAASINKAITTRIAIDATHERRRKRRKNAKLVQSVKLTPIVDADMYLDEYKTDKGHGEPKAVKDFTVKLKASPAEALPLAQYAKARGMLTAVTREDYTFTGIGRITTDERQMWSYILRRIRSQRTSGVIRFETMWRNLEIDGERTTAGAIRMKHDRMTKKLEKMLDQKAGSCFKSWSWHKDARGKVDGVEIVRNGRAKKN